MGARVLGIAYHLPDRVETNEDLVRENPDWELERIAERSGIYARRIAADNETASDLAVPAVQQLLRRAPTKQLARSWHAAGDGFTAPTLQGSCKPIASLL